MIPTATLRQMLKGLRRAFPAEKPVVVHQVANQSTLGAVCYREKSKYYEITLDKNRDAELLQWALLHEWAHVLTMQALHLVNEEYHLWLWAHSFHKLWTWWEKEWC